MTFTNEEARRRGDRRAGDADWLASKSKSTISAAHRRLQHLVAASQLGDEARLRLHLMEEHLHAAGVDVDDATFLADVKEIVRDLNRLILAGGKVELLREAFPAWASALMPKLRDERARRGR